MDDINLEYALRFVIDLLCSVGYILYAHSLSLTEGDTDHERYFYWCMIFFGRL